jgi:hypothetical protein
MRQDAKIVWVASMPRTGSMWCLNVTRALLRAAGRTVLPEHIPQHPQQMMAHADTAAIDSDPQRVWTLKTHLLIRPDAARSIFISPRRDPRDALMSYMRFMRHDFETALPAVRTWRELLRHYDGFPANRLLRLDYREIADRPAAAAGRIAAFLALALTPQTIETEVEAFSKAEVAKRIGQTERRLRERIAAGQKISPAEVVRLAGGAARAFDLETGFQSGHVSSYRDGDWRHLLTPEQQQRLEAALAR